MRAAFGRAFAGKRVFVTGHTGFKGSWLSLWLSELGAEVYGYALEPPTRPSLFEEANLADRLADHWVADIRDETTLTRAMERARPDIVFHLAAQPLVLASYGDPRETYDVNVLGAVNVLEAVRAVDSVRVCGVVTSDKCYADQELDRGYREDDAVGGREPYSTSKACAELVVASYRRFFLDPERQGTSLSSVRAGNAIGGGDWAEDRIIPDCIRALQTEASILVRNTAAVRPWQHVFEPLAGYLWLAACQWHEPARYAGSWNFGPDEADSATVQGIVEMVIREWGGGGWHTAGAVQQPGGAPCPEVQSLRLDITKARTALGWRPIWHAPEAVAQTVRWYAGRARQPDFDAARFSVAQIESYVAQAAGEGAAWAN